MTVESKKVQAQCSAERIYNFACDFRNFQRFLPSNVQDYSSDGNTCTFSVGGFMQLKLQMGEKTPYTKVSYVPAAGSNTIVPLTLALHIQPETEQNCIVYVAVDMEGGNPLISMTIKPKLKPALDKIAEQIQYYSSGI